MKTRLTLLFAALLAVASITTAAIALSQRRDDDAPAPHLVVAPSSTPQPTQVPPTPRPPVTPTAVVPTPTPDPAREGPEATLIDVVNNRALRLWQPGDELVSGLFSTDGRWFFYTRRNSDWSFAAVYRVDLNSPSLTPTKISEGQMGATNFDGSMLVFKRGPYAATSVPHLILRLRDGSEVDLGYGFMPVFSPDGRWLAYDAVEVTADLNRAMTEVLIDTQTLQSRVIAPIANCHLEPWQPPDGRRTAGTSASVVPDA